MKRGVYRYFSFLCAVGLVSAASAALLEESFDMDGVIFADDFEDGDLAGWTPGQVGDWTNSTVSAISGARSLKHNLTGVPGTSTIVAQPVYSLADGETVWRFNLRNGSWDPSPDNRFRMYLVADQADFAGTVSGYAVGVNPTNTPDMLTLWRVTAGTLMPLIESDLDWGSSQVVGVDVTRTAGGQWELRADADGGFDNLAWKGSAVDDVHSNTAFMGLVFVYTSTRAGQLRCDDVSITQSAGVADVPPSLQLVPAGTNKAIRVGDAVSFTVTATEPPNDAADAILLRAPLLPAGAVFPERSGLSPLSGTFAWTPPAGGVYVVAFAASDKDGTNTVAVRIEAVALDEGKVWINEFHYDNTSTDTNEGIEIAGPAGPDLSSYQVALYNGATGREYDRVLLSGRIDDEGDGFGAVWFDVPGIENGSPDGMALIRVQGGQTNLLQFLSYEGEFVAVDGPATGVRSRDVGVAETTNADPLGQSLQLVGRGRTAADLSWTGPIDHSRGRLNPGQYLLKTPTVLFVR